MNSSIVELRDTENSSIARAEDAELAALWVGQHHPRLLALADVHVRGAEGLQALDLGGLVVGRVRARRRGGPGSSRPWGRRWAAARARAPSRRGAAGRRRRRCRPPPSPTPPPRRAPALRGRACPPRPRRRPRPRRTRPAARGCRTRSPRGRPAPPTEPPPARGRAGVAPARRTRSTSSAWCSADVLLRSMWTRFLPTFSSGTVPNTSSSPGSVRRPASSSGGSTTASSGSRA